MYQYYLFRVELTLSKVEDQVWPQVVVGDNRGEMTMDPAVVAQIHERLAALTSDQMVRARVLSVVLQYNTLLLLFSIHFTHSKAHFGFIDCP